MTMATPALSQTTPRRRHDAGARGHPGFWAFVAHRVSGIVLALAVHLAGGVRLLLVEFVGWRAEWQKTAIALVAAAALACALLFALNG